MSVEYVAGDLLEMPAGITVIAHVVSRQGVLGAGIAKAIRDKWPAACEPYFAAFEDGRKPPLGSIIAAELPDNKRIVHMVAQDEIGTHKRQLSYGALRSCMEQIQYLLERAHAEGRTWVLGLPWVGCGLAGGSRRSVQAIIEDAFEASVVKCVVVERRKAAASTPLPSPTTPDQPSL